MVHPVRSTAASMSVMKQENLQGRLPGLIRGGLLSRLFENGFSQYQKVRTSLSGAQGGARDAFAHEDHFHFSRMACGGHGPGVVEEVLQVLRGAGRTGSGTARAEASGKISGCVVPTRAGTTRWASAGKVRAGNASRRG